MVKFFFFQVKTENEKMVSICHNDTYASYIQKLFLNYVLFIIGISRGLEEKLQRVRSVF